MQLLNHQKHNFPFSTFNFQFKSADMVELADTQDLGSCAAMRAGSTPVIRTKKEVAFDCQKLLLFYPSRQAWYIITHQRGYHQ